MQLQAAASGLKGGGERKGGAEGAEVEQQERQLRKIAASVSSGIHSLPGNEREVDVERTEARHVERSIVVAFECVVWATLAGYYLMR